MFDLCLFSPDDASRTDKKLIDIIKERVPQFQKAVAKIVALGWPIELISNGVTFDCPASMNDPYKNCGGGDVEALDEIAAHGIPVDRIENDIRPLLEIHEAENEYSNRVFYEEAYRKLRDPHISVCNTCQNQLHKQMTALAEEYGARSLLVSCSSDFERGVLHGKLEALRWVLQSEWADPVERIQQQLAEKAEEPDSWPDDAIESACSCYYDPTRDEWMRLRPQPEGGLPEEATTACP